MALVFPKERVGGVEFTVVRGLNKCAKCDETGSLSFRKDGDVLVAPFCECEFGNFRRKRYIEELDI